MSLSTTYHSKAAFGINPLPDDAMKDIAKKALDTNVLVAETAKRQIYISPDVLEYIVRDRTSRDSERGGARDAKRNIKNLAIQPLASYLSTYPEEAPVVMYVAGRPRFKHKDVSDPLKGWIEVAECYTNTVINTLLQDISNAINRPLVNNGLFIPKTMSSDEIKRSIVSLIKQGYNKFHTEMSGTKTVIKGD